MNNPNLKDNFTAILTNFTIYQRKINCSFRKDTGINKTELEILTYSNTVLCFNPYQVQIHFAEMNLQQVRLGIKKLIKVGAVEMIGQGFKNKPAVYIITNKGKQLLNTYQNYWLEQMNTGEVIKV